MSKHKKIIFLLSLSLILSVILVSPAFSATTQEGSSAVFTTLDITYPSSMIINDRRSVTIELKDQNGKDYVAAQDTNINLWSRNYEGCFFAKQFDGEYQSPISSVTVTQGTYKVNVWYQPFSYVPSDKQNILYFSFLDGQNNEQTVQAIISTVYPAGDSYINTDCNKYEEVVSDETDPKPVKLTFTIKDQYGNDQSSDTERKLDMERDANVKLFSDAECKNQIEGNQLTIPTNSVSVSVYAISQVADGHWLEVKFAGEDRYYGEGWYARPDKAVKLKLSSYKFDNKIRVGDYLPVKINAFDKFGNETYYYDAYLTAQLVSTFGNFYEDPWGGIITQASVKYGEFNNYWWNIIFYKSEQAGTATLSATIPGVEVEPLTVEVEEPQVNFHLFAYSNDDFGDTEDQYSVRPEWRVPLYPVFSDQFFGYMDLPYDSRAVSFEAYVITNGVSQPVGIFYDGYDSGTVTNKVYSDWEGYYSPIYFEVPANLPAGTKIYVKATPVSYPDESKVITLVVKTIPDFKTTLSRGWNVFSTPFVISNSNLLNVVDNPDYVQIAYGYKNGKWIQMTINDVNSMKVNPLEAYYVKVKGTTTTSFLSLNSPTAPPTKTLDKGWNLISPALDINSNTKMSAKEAFNTVTANSSILLSPVLNQEPFTVVDWNSNPNVYAGLGYWIYMNASTELAGFSTTPVTNSGAYNYEPYNNTNK